VAVAHQCFEVVAVDFMRQGLAHAPESSAPSIRLALVARARSEAARIGGFFAKGTQTLCVTIDKVATSSYV